MSSAAILDLEHALAVVRSVLDIGEEARSRTGAGTASPLTLIAALPVESDWRVYDHSAAVTRMYAVFARFIESRLSEWLSLAPILWEDYSTLSEAVREKHLDGIGRLLTQASQRRHRDVDWSGAVDGLRKGLQGEKLYSLEPKAFFSTERNYGPEVVESVYRGAGIDGYTEWARRHRSAMELVNTVLGGEGTVDAELRSLISYRNEAAHGEIDEVLGLNALKEKTQVIEAVAHVIADLVADHVVRRLAVLGHARRLGIITEVFSRANAVVAKVRDATISVGSRLMLRGASTCIQATVLSIQLGGTPTETLTTTDELEVGLRLSDGHTLGHELWTIVMPEGRAREAAFGILGL